MLSPYAIKVSMWSDECVNLLDHANHFTVYMSMKSSCYTLQTYTTFICQWYLSKAGKKGRKPGCIEILGGLDVKNLAQCLHEFLCIVSI